MVIQCRGPKNHPHWVGNSKATLQMTLQFTQATLDISNQINEVF
jgi:hypothetical protein